MSQKHHNLNPGEGGGGRKGQGGEWQRGQDAEG